MSTINMTGIRRSSFTANTDVTPVVKARLILDLMDIMEKRPGNFMFTNAENGDWLASASFDDSDADSFIGTGDTAYEAMTRLLSEIQ